MSQADLRAAPAEMEGRPLVGAHTRRPHATIRAAAWRATGKEPLWTSDEQTTDDERVTALRALAEGRPAEWRGLCQCRQHLAVVEAALGPSGDGPDGAGRLGHSPAAFRRYPGADRPHGLTACSLSTRRPWSRSTRPTWPSSPRPSSARPRPSCPRGSTGCTPSWSTRPAASPSTCTPTPGRPGASTPTRPPAPRPSSHRG